MRFPHPPDDALLALLEGRGSLDVGERVRLALHLEHCPPCRDALAAVARLARISH